MHGMIYEWQRRAGKFAQVTGEGSAKRYSVPKPCVSVVLG